MKKFFVYTKHYSVTEMMLHQSCSLSSVGAVTQILEAIKTKTELVGFSVLQREKQTVECSPRDSFISFLPPVKRLSTPKSPHQPFIAVICQLHIESTE